MSWGKWIIVAFVLFAGFIGTLVTICVRQDVNLVSRDYYQEELAYQEQIIRINNVAQLEHKPSFQKVGNHLEIRFADFDKVHKGRVRLFRPSDSSLDKSFELTKRPGYSQSISLTDVHAGMYRVRMEWVMEGKEFYVEEVIYL